MHKFSSKLLLVGVLLAGGQVPSAQAGTLSELLPEFLMNNNAYKAAQSDAASASQSIETARGAYYPTLDVTATQGREYQKKPDADDTRLTARELDVTVTQRIWDFGVTQASLDIANLQHEQTLAVLDTTRSSLLLRAFTAYVNVIRASQTLEFAVRSEKNVKHQTELEDALVQRGAGFTTDILQAKVQLAGAMARRVRAEGALEISRNAYRGVFLKETGPVESMTFPSIGTDKLPDTLEAAIELAMNNNSLLAASNIDSLIAQETVKQTFSSSYMPTIDGILDVKHKNDVSATDGLQEEIFAKVQINFPFNLGMTASNTLKATKFASNSAGYRYADAMTQVEERTRNAWQQLATAQTNAMLLTNQANIAAEFLVLARKERTLGRRSLLDVLSGEVALINASSDAASAKADVAIASVTLLDSMGALGESDLQ